MYKNVASQKVEVFAFDYSTGAPKTGDAANLTLYVNKDDAGVNALTDTSATELSSTNAPGWYVFDVSQSETNANKLHFTGKSSTSNVAVVGKVIYTDPANYTATSIDSSGNVAANVTQFNGANATSASGRPEVNTSHISGSAVSTSSAQLGVNLVNIGGAAVSTSSAQLGVNVVNAAGTAWASGAFVSGCLSAAFINALFDGTRTVCRGTVGSGTSPSTTQFTASAMSPSGGASDQFKGRILIFDKDTTTAALRGCATDITASSNASLPLFTYTALPTAPASGDTFSIV